MLSPLYHSPGGGHIQGEQEPKTSNQQVESLCPGHRVFEQSRKAVSPFARREEEEKTKL
jgi:hypothetical protein